nr:uncharacterized protein LOC113724276 [Coffea arabica]
MKPPGITEEQIKLRAFPFSLKDATKDWLYYLPAGSITTWAQLKKKFLEKFFLASRTVSLRREICSIKQYPGEFLYDYWERFNKLCTRCPQYQISEQLLIQYFYEGLQASDRRIIDAASGGALANKTPREAWLLIESMAENSQQFSFRENNHTRRVNEVETSFIQQQISELTSFVQQLPMGNMHQANAFGIYTNVSHPTDSCPLLQEDEVEQVNMVGDVSVPRFQQLWQPKPQPLSSNSGSSLEEIVKSLVTTTTQLQQETRALVTNTTQFQQDTRASMKDMETRMSQMATAINRLESHVYEKLPSQPETNPRNVSTMTLRSGKEVEGLKLVNSKSKSEEAIEK